MLHAVRLLLVLLSLMLPSFLLAQEGGRLVADESVTADRRFWNLQDADIHAVINSVSAISGKNFIIHPSVQGRITLVSTETIADEEVYPIFLSILQMLGYAAVESGEDVVKIVPASDAKQLGIPVAKGGERHVGDEVVVRVVPLKNVASDRIVPLLRPLLPSTEHIGAYPQSNLLIVSGAAASVNKIVSIVEEVDATNESDIEIITLRNAVASDAVRIYQDLRAEQRQTSRAGDTLSIAADERSNSIILSGNLPQRLQVKVFLAQLDDLSEHGDEGNTQVFHLNYLKANDFVDVLGSIAAAYVPGGVGVHKGAQQQRGQPGVQNVPSIGTAPGNNRATQSFGGGSQPQQFAQDIGGPVTASITASGNIVEIAAEPNTNSIVVTAPPAVMRVIRQVISQLDTRPAQVLVEAIIVEMTEKKLLEIGVRWGTPNDNFSPTGLGVGFIDTGFRDLRSVFNALRTDTESNILSTPTIVVADNQEAEIQVGTSFAESTGQFSTATQITTPFTTTAREEAMLRLKLTPQINRGDAVSLAIEQQNDVLTETTRGPGQNPDISKTSITTSVLVDDGAILVLGGLRQNQSQATNDRVPLLGALPLIGPAFTHQKNQVDVKHLMVFIRPVILHTPHDGLVVSGSRYHQIHSQQISNLGRMSGIDVLPPWGEEGAVLPPPFVR